MTILYSTMNCKIRQQRTKLIYIHSMSIFFSSSIPQFNANHRSSEYHILINMLAFIFHRKTASFPINHLTCVSVRSLTNHLQLSFAHTHQIHGILRLNEDELGLHSVNAMLVAHGEGIVKYFPKIKTGHNSFEFFYLL